MAKLWYVVHTYSGHENKVKANLEKAITAKGLQEKFGQILVATEDYAEMRDGKRTISRRKTFPSYVMVEMDMDEDTRHIVQSVPGGGLLSRYHRAVRIGESAIDRALDVCCAVETNLGAAVTHGDTPPFTCPSDARPGHVFSPK